MIRVILKHAVIGWLLFIMAFCLLSAPAYSADKAVAKLTSFSGTVLIKSRGDWGVKPETGLILYSDDKIVTKMGIATITFDDGAVIEIKANSNLLIRDTEQSGVAKQLGAVKRELRLLIGKILFRSGKGSNVATSLETTTMVCGLRGTAGTLSIDAAGQTYLQFTEGGGDTIGNFIAGIAADVPVEVASLNPAQRASFVAAAAADQAKRAAAKVANGEATNAEAALASANAAEAAAREALAAAEAMLNNPDESIRNEAEAAISAAQDAINAAKDAQQRAINAGATGSVLGKDTANFITTTGFDVQSGNFLKGKDDDAVLGNSYGVLGDALTRQVFSPTTQGNENQILPLSDVTPPVFEVRYAPAGIISSSSPFFEFTATESARYFYQLDGGALTPADVFTEGSISSLSLSGLQDGNHTLELIAQNSSGVRSAPQTFSWIQDTTAPVVTLMTAPSGSGTATLTPSHSNVEPGTVSYSFINSSGNIVSPTGLASGAYAVIATDQAGNNNASNPFTFILSNTAFSGSASGSGSVISGTVSSGLSSAIAGQSWGGWTTNMSGTWSSGPHSGTLSMATGGSTSTAGNWLSTTSGTIDKSTGAAAGTTNFVMLDALSLTKGTGAFSGTFTGTTSGTWTGTETGSGLTSTPLLLSGVLGSTSSTTPSIFVDYGTDVTGSSMNGHAGIVQNGSNFDYVFLGTYTNPSTTTDPLLLGSWIYGTDTLARTGLVLSFWKDGLINGFLTTDYDVSSTGNAGILYQALTGNYYNTDSASNSGMWLSQGTLTPIQMTSGIGITDTRYVDKTSSSLTKSYGVLYKNLNVNDPIKVVPDAETVTHPEVIKNADGSLNMLFGANTFVTYGAYTGTATDGWSLSLVNDDTATIDDSTYHQLKGLLELGPGSDDGTTITNSTWNSSTYELSAYLAGAWVNIDDALTGVMGGKLIGTFDPAALKWEAIGAGGLVETNTFLAMAATDAGRTKLRQLDIPCIEVGSTTLTGSGGALTSVTMNNVKFFAYSTGAAPKIWATGDVQGNVSAVASPVGSTAILSGSSGTTSFNNVSFTMNAYGNVGGTWNATVSGTGGTVGIHNNVTIQGWAAGAVHSTGFQGTSSGVAR